MNNYKPKMVVGTKYRKLADQTETANAWGDWDPKEFTVEDSAFGFVRMKNGALIICKASEMNDATANVLHKALPIPARFRIYFAATRAASNR